MKDTGFSVLGASAPRLAKIYATGEDGKLKPTPPILVGSDATKTVALPSGGGGLYSTAADYARFLQMLLNGGELEGVRVLSRKTVELMMVNHLAPGVHPFGGSDGFGLGGSVRLDLASAAIPGSVGVFGWSGAATTYARIDPNERMILLLLLQHFPFDQHEIFWLLDARLLRHHRLSFESFSAPMNLRS
jgi:CubicO group peptidase (beta-lactamase class C family)